jgi:hypothetical protein
MKVLIRDGFWQTFLILKGFDAIKFVLRKPLYTTVVYFITRYAAFKFAINVEMLFYLKKNTDIFRV